jgi:hypothetical protein
MPENALSTKTIDEAIQTVLRSVESPNTKRDYARALNDFKEWYLGQDQELSKTLVQAYAAQLQGGGMDALKIN